MNNPMNSWICKCSRRMSSYHSQGNQACPGCGQWFTSRGEALQSNDEQLVNDLNAMFTDALRGNTTSNFMMLTDINIPMHQAHHLCRIADRAHRYILGPDYKKHAVALVDTCDSPTGTPTGTVSIADDLREALADVGEYVAKITVGLVRRDDLRSTVAALAAISPRLEAIHSRARAATEMSLSFQTADHDQEWMKPVRAMPPSRHYGTADHIKEIKSFIRGRPQVSCVLADDQYHVDHYLIIKGKQSIKIPIDHWIVVDGDQITPVPFVEFIEKYRLR